MSVPTTAGERRYVLNLQQQYQEVRGTAAAEGESVLLSNATLTGDRLGFTVTTTIQGEEVKMAFDGRVSGDAMRGKVDVQGGSKPGQFTWSAQRQGQSPNATR
jgi:hypothetical protein